MGTIKKPTKLQRMPEFKDLKSEEKSELIQKIGEVLKKHDLGEVEVKTVTEDVCNLTASSVEKNVTLSVSKDLPSTKGEAAKAFTEDIKPIIEGYTGVEVAVVSKLGAGDQYATIADIMPLDSEEHINLEHKQGEVWLVDFWATWCPPCQAPMAHNQEMLKKRGADWAGKIRIIGVSSDQGKDPIKKRIEERGWGDIEHYWKDKSNCSQVYNVKGIPHVMLIDKEGKIAFKGHPANRPNLEQDLDDLAEGKAITGEGTAPAEPSGDEGAGGGVPEGFKELDSAATNAECDSLHETLASFTTDEEMKKLAQGFPRAFCVLVLQESYIPSTGKSYMKYENYRVLVGPKDNLEKIKGILAEKLNGTFEVILREQAM